MCVDVGGDCRRFVSSGAGIVGFTDREVMNVAGALCVGTRGRAARRRTVVAGSLIPVVAVPFKHKIGVVLEHVLP